MSDFLPGITGSAWKLAAGAAAENSAQAASGPPAPGGGSTWVVRGSHDQYLRYDDMRSSSGSRASLTGPPSMRPVS
eukprot:SAG22_NODE_6607_length_832_cov_0.821282_3_plen_75_part_01